MTFDHFKRVPSHCGVWRKLKPVNTDRWLRNLLGQYIDETTKQNRPDGWHSAPLTASKAERRALVEAGLAPLEPGEDYTPFASGIWTFGHLASTISSQGYSTTYAQGPEVIHALTDWWVADRSDSAIKAHHIVASFDSRIAHELNKRGYPVDAMLLSSLHQTLSQYTAKFYPNQTLGWVASCHHDAGQPHAHALVHPTTSDGTLIRVSGMKTGEQGEDRFDFLRENFNTRARQLFMSLTGQSGPSQERLGSAARQFITLSHHAMKEVGSSSPDALDAASKKVVEWLGARDFDSVAEQAARGAEEDFRLTTPGTPDPEAIRARGDEILEEFQARSAAEWDAAATAVRTLIGSRKGTGAYSPVLTPGQPPTLPLRGEYFAFVEASSGKRVTNYESAWKARRTHSDAIRRTANAVLKDFRSAIEAGRRNLDLVNVQTGFRAAHYLIAGNASLELPLSFGSTEAAPGRATPRLIMTPSKQEAFAEREMANVADIEARAHLPEDPNATPDLLASNHYPRFRQLAVPSVNLPDRTPTL